MIIAIIGVITSIHSGYIFAILLIFNLSFIINTNYSLKAISNPVIKEINDDEYDTLFNSLPQELKVIENLGFKIFAKIHYKISSNNMKMIFFNTDKKDVIFGIYIYRNNKLLPYYSTSFGGTKELTTSNSKNLATSPKADIDYYQLFEDKTIAELLKIHTDSVKVLKIKFGLETIQFIEPSQFIEYFKNIQIEKYRRLAPLIFFKVIKIQISNNLKEISKPIEEQLNEIDNSNRNA